MPYASYMQLKGADNDNIFELKGWRWEIVMNREIKVHPTKSFPTNTPNPSIGLDFGSYTTHYLLQGRLKTQRQLNRLKTLCALTWYETAQNNIMVTLTIGTGAAAITTGGVIEGLHSEWSAENNYFNITLKYYETTIFII